uniref:NAF domain-containing protein n=1 Tax=Macrostomum lignano TaxID=282301 RepID=A0A1I8IZE0_9PLAT
SAAEHSAAAEPSLAAEHSAAAEPSLAAEERPALRLRIRLPASDAPEVVTEGLGLEADSETLVDSLFPLHSTELDVGIDEPTIELELSTVLEEEEEAFVVVEEGSQKGKATLISNLGFTFVRNCSASVIESGGTFTNNRAEHNHFAPGVTAEQVALWRDLKADGKRQLFHPAAEIVEAR